MSVENHVFMMGKFEANIPDDRLYSKIHMWLQPTEENPNRFRVGFTHYSVRLLQDVYFLDWSVDEGAAVREGKEIGEIESSKAVSSLYPTTAGNNIGFNQVLLDDPSAINVDNYGNGWLYEIDIENPNEFLDAKAYVELLEASWEKTQQKIKGQLH